MTLKPKKEEDPNFVENNEIAASTPIIPIADHRSQNIDHTDTHLANVSTITKNELPGIKTSMSVLDIPDEVKRNISGFENIELDELLVLVIGSFTMAISTDRIILALWTSYKKNYDRAKVMARLRYLSKSNTIEKIEGVRSMYKIPSPVIETAK